ncbi:MAG: glycosyltransferase family 4 protein [Ignavibacteria bacterium]|nr:glycosyltransferase family 4 protein [Ignavibacteria bacterium]
MGSKNKILFLRTDAGVYDPRIRKESSSLKALGYDVRVFGWDRRSEFPHEEIINGVRYRRSRIPAPYGSKTLLFVLPVFWLQAIWEMVKEWPDMVHACDLDAMVPAIFMKPVLRLKVVYDIFDNFADKITNLPSFVRNIIKAFDHFTMRFADVVIVTDEYRKSLLSDRSQDAIQVIMNVPPTLKIDLGSRDTSCFRVCYAGVIHEHRGLHIIAEAVRGLDGIETVFAGWIPRQIDYDYLTSRDDLRYVGKLPYEESLKLMAESDIILALYDPSLPINAIASSNKIFEAMSVSRPVITNIETTMARIVSEEQCGSLIAYGSPALLREEIVRLHDHPLLREQLGRNGYSAFCEKYNWNIMEKRLKSIYSRLLPESEETPSSFVDC